MSHGRILDFRGHTFGLSRATASEATALDLALEAIDRLTFFQALGAELRLAPRDPQSGRCRTGESRRIEPVTREILSRWIDPKRSWSELAIDATRVRLREAWSFAGRQTISLESEVGLLEVPLERDEHGAWTRGPHPSMPRQPPLALRFGFEWLEELTLDVTVDWSIGQSFDDQIVREELMALLPLGWTFDDDE